jgi:hypothetical protein
MSTYNSHKNYQTWNVSLWINNDISLYNTAKQCESYKRFIDYMIEFNSTATPDGVAWADKDLDYESLDELIQNIMD